MHSVVRVRGLKSKSEWNECLAQIVGPFSRERQRYPIMMLLSREIACVGQTFEFLRRSRHCHAGNQFRERVIERTRGRRPNDDGHRR